MGADLFDRFPAQVALAQRELGYDVRDMCERDPQGQLNQTQFTQPALFLVNALTFFARLLDTGERPQVVVGHSLGEYSALFAAGVFDLSTGLRLVKARGALMAEAKEGAMAAVIGLEATALAEVLAGTGLSGIDIANFNSPKQTVISGPVHEIEASKAPLAAAGVMMWKRLPVSAAFHSRYMAGSARAFAETLAGVTLAPPQLTVLSNVTALPHESTTLKQMLARQITSPVRWTETMRWLFRQTEPEFVEVGPGNVLRGLLRRMQMEAGNTV
ncbi:MAG: ACP S-malonyltransferase [Candidatus Synoicihabitans palmerolidicus]|nr:ACP S-malonyltransferase [Candidatus Synoicihabitans palmerolidicus]MCC5025940.1 ACP S-malonyltransferase [Candidatus Synoicihabitans palmerolidicus]MCC5025979.1 ACP S-malonyltransferase [Candidatus Synoicihabitans palmerolidicus]MCC5026023.1 ACP S-malonyltransferase [Candidatus Synoicihabitans palmerolidicus]MCC5026055.1 ACP S-malonyltransferase [Candidatus Synoicihabitans palmerolidicus]